MAAVLGCAVLLWILLHRSGSFDPVPSRPVHRDRGIAPPESAVRLERPEGQGRPQAVREEESAAPSVQDPSLAVRVLPSEDEGTAWISGIVRLRSAPPESPGPRLKGRPEESLIVDEQLGLSNALVCLLPRSLENPWGGEPRSVRLEGGRFTPRVTAVVPGQAVVFRNQDATAHDLAGAWTGGVRLGTGQSTRLRWSGPVGPVEFGCLGHEEEKGWVVVNGSRSFDVTEAGGGYRITGIPPGEYLGVVWHERCGEVRRPLSILDKGPTTLDFELPTPKGP